MKDKNCGTCYWRNMETRISRNYDNTKPLTASNLVKVVWLCNNSDSDKYKQDVSEPHGNCEAWEG